MEVGLRCENRIVKTPEQMTPEMSARGLVNTLNQIGADISDFVCSGVGSLRAKNCQDDDYES